MHPSAKTPTPKFQVPKLGAGLAYQPALRPFIEAQTDAFDYLEVVPDILWTDLGHDQDPRYVDDAEGVDFIRQVHQSRPVIPHGIGLSIGSAHRFNRGQIYQLERWFGWLDFPWHSDHLAYNLAAHGIDEMNVGVTIPLPRDQQTLDLLSPRIAEIQRRLPIPFLLENNVYFFDFPESEFDDAEFLNTLCQRTGAGLLLDLHNVYTNCRNHGSDPLALLDALDLEHVVEIHIAGGMERDGFYLDAHCGPSPEAVWQLLDHVLPGCSNLGGVTFELLGSWYDTVGADRLRVELDRMREVWHRHQPSPAASWSTPAPAAATAETEVRA